MHEEELARIKEEDRNSRLKKDQELAKKLLDQEREEQDKLRNLNNRDAEFARALFEEEKRRIEDEKLKLKEQEDRLAYQKTIELQDQEMARILREKEDLERRLNQVNNMKNYDVDVNGVTYPNTWVWQSQNVQNFDVPMYSTEWYNVYNVFVRTCNNKTITRIERVQNKALWTWFYLKKQFMSKKTGGCNERLLFHGSKTNAYDIILRDGFDHRVADLGGMLGAGIYFAENSSYSVNYIPNVNNVNNNNYGKKKNNRFIQQNTKRMMYCRVLLGSVGRGANGIRRPPNKPYSEELYDSVSNNGNIFAVFDNHQAYPEYIIHFY